MLRCYCVEIFLFKSKDPSEDKMFLQRPQREAAFNLFESLERSRRRELWTGGLGGGGGV